MHEELRNRRTAYGKTLEEISDYLKIKRAYLEAIEEGRFDDLPEPVYTRFYIKAYATLLNLDPSLILNEYEEYILSKQISKKTEIQEFVQINEIEQTKRKKFKISLPKKLPKWAVKFAIILVVIVAVTLLVSKKNEQIPPPPAIIKEETNQSQKLVEKKQTTVENKKEEQKPVEEIQPQQQSLKIEANDLVWMRIIIDNKDRKEIMLNPGDTINLKANKSFKLHIGNAGGVKVIFNDKELGPIGEKGQVVYLDLPEKSE